MIPFSFCLAIIVVFFITNHFPEWIKIRNNEIGKELVCKNNDKRTQSKYFDIKICI